MFKSVMLTDTCKEYKPAEVPLPLELFFSTREERDNYR